MSNRGNKGRKNNGNHVQNKQTQISKEKVVEDQNKPLEGELVQEQQEAKAPVQTEVQEQDVTVEDQDASGEDKPQRGETAAIVHVDEVPYIEEKPKSSIPTPSLDVEEDEAEVTEFEVGENKFIPIFQDYVKVMDKGRAPTRVELENSARQLVTGIESVLCNANMDVVAANLPGLLEWARHPSNQYVMKDDRLMRGVKFAYPAPRYSRRASMLVSVFSSLVHSGSKARLFGENIQLTLDDARLSENLIRNLSMVLKVKVV